MNAVASRNGETSFRGATSVVLVIGSLMLAPPVYSIHKLGIEAVFNFFAQDAFAYLAVAQHSTMGFYSFDGELATNGFHPLWQMYLTGLFHWAQNSDQVFQLYVVFFSCILFTTLGYIVTGLAAYTITKSKVLAILTVPGIFYLTFSFVMRFFNSPWSFMNGMESCLSVLCGGMLFGVLSLHYNDPEKYDNSNSFFLIIGIIICLMVMSRLDDIFLLCSFSVCIVLFGKQTLKARLLKAGLLSLPSALFLTGYLLFNLYTVGLGLPISGLAKAGWAMWDNLGQLISILVLEPFPREESVHLSFVNGVYRHIQMTWPMLISIWFVAWIWTHRSVDMEGRQKNVYFVALLVYVCLKALYNLIAVHTNYQGISWYYSFSIMTINFVALILLSKAHWQWADENKLVKMWAVALLAIFLIIHVIFATKKTLDRGNILYAFWKDRKMIVSTLSAKSPGLKLVEFDDGVINYSLGIPSVHGTGFVLDYQGYLASKNGRFLDYCYKRGFNTLASLQYIRIDRPNPSSTEIEALYRETFGPRLGNLSKYNFDLIFVHEESGASFARFEPKPGKAENGGH
jgi:hypothetical protein